MIKSLHWLCVAETRRCHRVVGDQKEERSLCNLDGQSANSHCQVNGSWKCSAGPNYCDIELVGQTVLILRVLTRQNQVLILRVLTRQNQVLILNVFTRQNQVLILRVRFVGLHTHFPPYLVRMLSFCQIDIRELDWACWLIQSYLLLLDILPTSQSKECTFPYYSMP